MKSWHIVCCGVIALAASGCRSNDNHEPLYTEMRWLEDRIYDLQDHLDQAESELDACHHENLRLRQRLADAGVGENLGPPLPPRTSPLPPPPQSPVERPSSEPLTPPQVEGIPMPGDSELRMPPDAQDSAVDDRSASRTAPTARAAPPATDGALLRRITLNRALTGGCDRDGVAGDEGLLVVVEPRSPIGAIVDVPGDISIVALDPALDGQAARVARWDITSAESAEILRETPVGQGLQLELPWPDKPPANPTLMLFVRYATADGGKYVADQQIEINLPGSAAPALPAASSTPAPPGRFFPSGEPAKPLSAAPAAEAAPEAAAGRKPQAVAEKQGTSKQPAKPQRPQWTPYR